MAGRRKSSLAISAEQARLALSVLIHEGKLAARDVRSALARRERLIREIRARLHALGVGGMEMAGSVRKEAVTRFQGKRKTRRKLSSATRAKYRLQGAYMGFVRNLPKAAKAQVRAIREKSGVRSAIAAARKMARRK
jgi:hypothetical protein